MFGSIINPNLAGRSRALLATARTLLLIEDDHDVDWEVDQETAAADPHPHRERLGAPWRPRHRRRPGQIPGREQVCLCPLPSRDGHRQAAPSMTRVAAAGSAERQRAASCAAGQR